MAATGSPSGSDHLKRDARDASFHEIAVELGKYRRRLVESAYRQIDQLIAESEGEVSGTAIGRQAAARALTDFGVTEAREAIEVVISAASGMDA